MPDRRSKGTLQASHPRSQRTLDNTGNIILHSSQYKYNTGISIIIIYVISRVVYF